MKRVELLLVGFVLLFGLISFVSGISETVTCIFENSDEEQKCFAGFGAGSFLLGDYVIRFSCIGIGECEALVNFDDKIIEKYNLKPTDLDIYWHNMEGCRGEGVKTVIDGNGEIVRFDCDPAPVNVSQGFLYAVWTCEDGTEGEGGDGELCKSRQRWYSLGQHFCANPSLYPEGVANRIRIEIPSKGELKITALPELKSFEVSQECYREPTETTSAYWEGTNLSSLDYWPDGTPKEKPNEEGICESGGCPYNNLCYLVGSIVHYHYCSTDGIFIEQLDKGVSCVDNYQCVSDFCSNGECKLPDFFRRLANLFKQLFS